MRTLFSRLRILILVMAVIACETEPVIFQGPYFVRFSDTEIVEKESFTKPILVVVHNGGPALSEDAFVYYDISGSAREGVDYIINGTPGQVTIPQGEHFGTIEIALINNANNILRSQDLVITLRSTNAERRIGQGESGIGKEFRLTIQDDCILGGTYIGSRGSFSAQVSITSGDCELYLLSNWNIGVFVNPVTMDLTFIDNGDNTLTIPTQEEQELPEDLATIQGTGVVDPITRQIILTITLVDFASPNVYTLTFIPD